MVYSKLLGLQSGDVVALIGSGGKTSLLWRLAAENHGRRVLVSTTTKMYSPAGAAFGCPPSFAGAVVWDISDIESDGQPKSASAKGMHLLHGGEVGGKIIAPSMERLAAASEMHELTFLECDGSKRLPLKGWAEHEPVIPTFTTITVGVLPLWVLGQPVEPMLVHRMERFCQLTGANPGEPVTMAHLAALIQHPAGLFQKKEGRRVLFLNYCKGVSGPERALELVGSLANEPPGVRPLLPDLRRVPDDILAGDIHRGTVRRIG